MTDEVAPSAELPSDKTARELELLKAATEKTLDELISDLKHIRAERKRLADLDKLLVEEWRAAEGVLIKRLDEQKVNRVSTDVATATITEEDVPMVLDWDAFYDYLIENRATHLLQRRVATAAWRELVSNGFPVPGIDVYKKREISLRKR